MPSFDIGSFISANNDFARAYTFYVKLPNFGGLGEDASYLVRSSSLPSSNFETRPVDFQGLVYNMGVKQKFDNWTVDFYCDTVQWLRTEFLTWANTIHNPRFNTFGAPGINTNSYMRDMQVQHISHKTGQPILTYDFKLAWPSNVGEIVLDYAQKSIAYFQVTFSYSWFETK